MIAGSDEGVDNKTTVEGNINVSEYTVLLMLLMRVMIPE